MSANVRIRGSVKHAATVIKFLESIGGNNSLGHRADAAYAFYHVDPEGVIRFEAEAIKREITLQQAQDILDGIATLRDDGTIEYSKTPGFPRMMWVWNNSILNAIEKEVHGHIPTIKCPYVDIDGLTWEHASDTDPRTPELTIEEAEAKYNIKIKRQ